MERNNRMEQLLVKLAEKQGIHLDPKEAERQEEEEAYSQEEVHSYPYANGNK